jgi:hypothetical protein
MQPASIKQMEMEAGVTQMEHIQTSASRDRTDLGTSQELLPENSALEKSKSDVIVSIVRNHYGAIIFIIFAVTILLLGRFVANWDFGWKGWTALGLIFCSFLAMIKSIADPEW